MIVADWEYLLKVQAATEFYAWFNSVDNNLHCGYLFCSYQEYSCKPTHAIILC